MLENQSKKGHESLLLKARGEKKHLVMRMWKAVWTGVRFCFNTNY